MLPFSLVVAATRDGGIGRNGQLPWRLPGDMAFFKRLTIGGTDDASTGAQPMRAVLMGRKTWESIPSRFRPLPHRWNVILTRQPGDTQWSTEATAGNAAQYVLVESSLPRALARLAEACPKLEQVFVIGGGQLYRDAIRMQECQRIYLTLVEGATVPLCDTFFPEISDTEFRLLPAAQMDKELDWAVPRKRQENNLHYEFLIYERSVADNEHKENLCVQE